MLYLTDAAGPDGAALGTLRGWLAAINRVHLEAGHPPPGHDPGMRLYLRGLSRTTPPRPATQAISALRLQELRTVCQHLDAQRPDPRPARDRVILLLHCLCLGDGELARLSLADLDRTSRGYRLHVRAVRAGRRDRTVDTDTSPPGPDATQALDEWVDANPRESPTAPLLTAVDAAGRRSTRALTAKAVHHARHSRQAALGRPGTPAPPLQAAHRLAGPPTELLRDKALLLLGFAGAFRRTELTGLVWSDLQFTTDGIVVNLRRSKTDSAGRGRTVGIPRGRSQLTFPVTALTAWAQRTQTLAGQAPDPIPTSEPTARSPRRPLASAETAGIAERPCFVTIGRSGRLGSTHLTPEALTRLVQRRAADAGITGRWGGRSLRAGIITTAAELDIPLEQIPRQSRHATLDSLALYIRNEDPFRRNACSRLGI